MLSKVWGIIAIAVGAVGIVLTGVDIAVQVRESKAEKERHEERKKLEEERDKRLLEKVGAGMETLEKASMKEIQEKMVEKAVEQAATDVVDGYVRRVRNEIVGDARTKIYDEVRRATEAASKEIREQVAERIGEEASMIDMDVLRRRCRDRAEEKIIAKFDGNLEEMLDKFNDNLKNLQKIYGGIADSLQKTNADNKKEFKLSLG